MAVSTVFKTAPQRSSPPREGDDSTGKDVRSRQIDELVRITMNLRREVYGQNWDQHVRDFYYVRPSMGLTPTFRPKVQAPQLQSLLLGEANDLTDSSIRAYIWHKKSGRDKKREESFQAHWREIFVNNRLLTGAIWAMFSGTSFMYLGYDPMANRGEGEAWVRAGRPHLFHPDPSSPYPEDWNWLIVEEEMQLDEIKMRWPDHADEIRSSASSDNLAGPPAAGIELPPGPMSVTVRGLPSSQQHRAMGTATVRFAYLRDMTIVPTSEVQKQEFIAAGVRPPPKYVPKYPRGRFIVDAEGIVLADGDSWVPFGMMPAIPIFGLPPLESVFAPSPISYTRSLQDVAERHLTQNFENATRLNNGMLILREETGLTADNVGGVAGEIVVVNSNSPPDGVRILYPPPMPPQMTQLPLTYLQLQRELQGHGASRQGQPGAGNISADLFETALEKSQTLTQLRARLFAESVERVAELLFYIMCEFYTDERQFPLKGGDRAVWNFGEAKDYKIRLDEGSIRLMSHARLQTLAVEMKKAGLLDTKHALDWLDVPDSEDIAAGIQKEMELAALAKVQRR